MRIDWSFLDSLNTTALKGWSVVWLWLFTGAMWGVAVVLGVVMGKGLPSEWLGVWLGGLTLYSGVGAYQYKTMRDTDYGAIERKAGLVPGATSGATGEHPTPPAKGTV
jgi:hypothetical protein